MATPAIIKFMNRESHFPMTFPAPFPFKYLGHFNIVSSILFFEWFRMATITTNHIAMDPMWKQNIWHEMSGCLQENYIFKKIFSDYPFRHGPINT